MCVCVRERELVRKKERKREMDGGRQTEKNKMKTVRKKVRRKKTMRPECVSLYLYFSEVQMRLLVYQNGSN